MTKLCITGSLWRESTGVPVDSPHKWPVMQKTCPCRDTSMKNWWYIGLCRAIGIIIRSDFPIWQTVLYWSGVGQGPLVLTEITPTSNECRAWISNCIQTKLWDVTAHHPCPNWNGDLSRLSWWRHEMEKFSALLVLWGHGWIPLTKASDADLWCFLWSAPEETLSQDLWNAILAFT